MITRPRLVARWTMVGGGVLAMLASATRVRADEASGPFGVDVTVGEMAEGLKRHSGAKAFDLIEWKRDEMIAKIVAGWPKRLDSKRARKMGFQSDTSMDELIRNYVEDDMPKAA